MKPYNPKSTCRKCGGKSVTTMHCNGADAFCSTRLDYDHIERCCRNCGYRWAEKTIDAEEK